MRRKSACPEAGHRNRILLVPYLPWRKPASVVGLMGFCACHHCGRLERGIWRRFGFGLIVVDEDRQIEALVNKSRAIQCVVGCVLISVPHLVGEGLPTLKAKTL